MRIGNFFPNFRRNLFAVGVADFHESRGRNAIRLCLLKVPSLVTFSLCARSECVADLIRFLFQTRPFTLTPIELFKLCANFFQRETWSFLLGLRIEKSSGRRCPQQIKQQRKKRNGFRRNASLQIYCVASGSAWPCLLVYKQTTFYLMSVTMATWAKGQFEAALLVQRGRSRLG